MPAEKKNQHSLMMSERNYTQTYVPAMEFPRATIQAPVNVARSTTCINYSKVLAKTDRNNV